MNDLTIPRLARGSWHSRAGVGCIMNLKSWEKQSHLSEPLINDTPPGFSLQIQRALIAFNDSMCLETTTYQSTFRRAAELLCPKCTMWLVDMANTFDGSDRAIASLSCMSRTLILELVNSAVNKIQTLLSHNMIDIAKRDMERAAEMYLDELQKLNYKPVSTPEATAAAAKRMNAGGREVTKVLEDTKATTVAAKTITENVNQFLTIPPESMKLTFSWTDQRDRIREKATELVRH